MADSTRYKHSDIQQTTQRLLALIGRLYTTTQAGRTPPAITLETSLERELGFDSLTRAELLTQVERTFGTHLPEQALGRVETPGDLLRELLQSQRLGTLDPHTLTAATVVPARATCALPSAEQAMTLPDVLNWHVERQPERTHLYIYTDSEHVESIGYASLLSSARQIAAGLQQRGLLPGQTVALMLPTCFDYFRCFFGAMLAGGIPVPIYPPARASQIEDHLRRHAGILNNAGAVLLITIPAAKTVSRLLQLQAPSVRQVLTATELEGDAATLRPHRSRPDDLALLQYTSGSTGNPKGVMLTHANLLANLRAMGRVIRVGPSDVFISWLPLYHDMGLIGAWLGSLYFAMPLVVMSPLLFLTRPETWLWAIHRYRGTLSAAPNFAYELCLRKLDEEALEGLDLSCWRIAFNGAEPVSPITLRRFSERFAAYGLRPEAMSPVYGLAESSVGLAFPPFGRRPLIDRIQRNALMRKGQAVPAAPDDTQALEFVAVGQPIPGHQVRIVDDTGHELPERQEGRLEFKGPSCTQGYYNNPDATARLLRDGWLDSGDRAYIAGGDIYITGRCKDIIIKAGRNIYPHELESAVSEIEGVRRGCVAVFASHDRQQATEQLVVLAETSETETARREGLRQAIEQRTLDLLGIPADQVVLAPPHSVPKTSSGKIRRAASRELYEAGKIGQRRKAVWQQVVSLVVAGLAPQLIRARRWLGEMSYAVYGWGLFWLLAPLIWCGVVLSPRVRWSRAVLRGGARLLLRLSATPLQVEGLDRLPQGSACVIVANHASYLDALVLSASLPLEYSFVAKGELRRKRLPRLFLQRLHTEFVERFDRQQGIADARRIAKTAGQGNSLLFFPEGTLDRMPGLRCFHMGAFVAAVEANVPVVPVVLRGTRSKLRDESWFLRRGGVQVMIGEPLLPQGSDWNAAVKLRKAARDSILRRCGEPDLDIQ